MKKSTRKPVGRPPGSKNKSSSSTQPVSQPLEPSMKVFSFRVPPNRDIMEFILNIAHNGHVSVAIISASGTVNNVTLHNSTMQHGPFTLLSLAGSYLYNNLYTLYPGATPPFPLSFTINLSTPNGHIFGGVISGSVIARQDVKLTVSTFKNSGILKFPPDLDNNKNNNNNTTTNNNTE
ncbi:hypothetical protein LR48_Vigan10g065600 [Vigna angularis]|uniref:AT-hook motif nuclear-localized protein n=1 Tax=Phaseolus angularis TaxID=3914 RepID=A0A0L9VJ50_PHAAN|nr:AT-hook motif nuclear-localized protein 17 [Vigna angularis]KAG2394599.1 AT-hook motif nuclear-localized protein [Vigna angularis]KOM54764.1 hypothetical protein LR48_Vigan10g065600 [Vigna angularis]